MPVMLFDAIEFAARAHRGHYRKGTCVPYLIHPLSVATILIQHGSPDEVVVAGLLHDTVEDTQITLAEIRERFGEQVARLVEAVSEPDKSDTWENRKVHAVRALETACLGALLVAAADKLDNLRSVRAEEARLGADVWSRFNRPKAKQAWYHRAVLDVLRRRLREEPGASLVRELEKEVEAVFGE